MMDWPEFGVVARRLMAEAGGDAKRLGHELDPWRPGGPQMYQAACYRCKEPAKVYVRKFRGAPVAGAAVELRCPGVS